MKCDMETKQLIVSDTKRWITNDPTFALFVYSGVPIDPISIQKVRLKTFTGMSENIVFTTNYLESTAAVSNIERTRLDLSGYTIAASSRFFDKEKNGTCHVGVQLLLKHVKNQVKYLCEEMGRVSTPKLMEFNVWYAFFNAKGYSAAIDPFFPGAPIKDTEVVSYAQKVDVCSYEEDTMKIACQIYNTFNYSFDDALIEKYKALKY